MKQRILNHVGIMVVLSVILTFIAASAVMYGKYNHYMKQDVRNEAEYIRYAVENTGKEYLNKTTGDLTTSRITLAKPDGTILYDSEKDASDLENHKDRPEIIEAKKEGTGEVVRFSQTLSKQTFYYAVKLNDGNILRVAKTTDSVLSTMLSSFTLLGLLLIAILALAFFVVEKQTRRLIAPINELDLEHPLEHVAYEELRPLLNRVDEQNVQIAKQVEELKQAEMVRREFSANVSHELKTPLTSMKVLADSLVGQEGVPEELYQEFMGDITAEIDRENKIITDLLSLVKMDKKAADLNVEHLNINQLLEDILKRLRPIADKRHIDLILDSFRPVEADVDEVKFTLAVSNLVENGIKYNVDDGWVRVTLDADHKYFYVKVADSGMGIPEESIGRIFERFYRVDKSHSKEIGGTGLGLAITRSAVTMHHGTIQVASKEGEGTTFTVRIPLSYIP